eukprot:2406433-Amphidinium_carterae.3
MGQLSDDKKASVSAWKSLVLALQKVHECIATTRSGELLQAGQEAAHLCAQQLEIAELAAAIKNIDEKPLAKVLPMPTLSPFVSAWNVGRAHKDAFSSDLKLNLQKAVDVVLEHMIGHISTPLEVTLSLDELAFLPLLSEALKSVIEVRRT